MRSSPCRLCGGTVKASPVTDNKFGSGGEGINLAGGLGILQHPRTARPQFRADSRCEGIEATTTRCVCSSQK